jgi:chromosome partitioning protein
MMRRIAVLNQKGGVGKTTTSVNLAAALADCGKRVCVVDLDPQAHASLHLGVVARSEESIYEVLCGNATIDSIRQNVSDTLAIVPASLDLAGAELELANEVGRETILKDRLDQSTADFDFMIFDCPPSLSVLTLNALTAVDEVFLPLQPHFLALHGLSKLLRTIELVAKRLNNNLRLTGIVLCMYETSTRLAAEVTRDVADFIEQQSSNSPTWANAKFFQSKIRRNIRLAEAPSFGKSIFEYAPTSHGAEDYLSLAYEVLGRDCSEADTDQDRSGRGKSNPATAQASNPLVDVA